MTNHQDAQNRLYNERQILFAMFFGGPLAGGYMAAENFKYFEEKDRGRKTWLCAGLVTLFIFSLVFIPAAEKIPNTAIPLCYTIIGFYLVNHLQGARINAHKDSGQPFFSWWRSIGITVAAMVVTCLLIVGGALLAYEIEKTSLRSQSYDPLHHEINFRNGDVTQREVDRLAEIFRQVRFFDEQNRKSVLLKTIPDGYEIAIPVAPQFQSDKNLTAAFAQLRAAVQTHYPDKKIVLVLFIDNVDHVIQRLE